MDRRALPGLKDTARKTGGGGGGAPQNSYLRLPTITANVMRSGGRRGVMTVETGLDTPDAALRERVAQSAPRLRAAYAAVVQTAANSLLPGAPPDVERLVAQLQAATDRTLGRRGARLLIGTVMVV
ncbi:Tat pathway signal protein [Brevundimonas sp.]|uniref:Tat pathway signal protein n=1 Tax=Brevundimonas sp. TaxID=1871086 RepID=UPI002D74C7EE|nr:Tat pathway signal protein [Brevundimonas sp.]HYC74996.1 Tat pathway signal protein [Brevundimonas sp.]